MAGKTGAIRAGRAFVELFADDRRLVRGLRAAQKRLSAFGASVRGAGLSVAAAGAGLLAPLLASVKGFSDVGDAIDKMAIRTGVSVEALSELGFAAEQSGADLQTLEVGLRTMQRSVFDAERGLSTAVDALDALGLSVEELRGLSPESQFKLIADRISKVEDPTRRAALAMQLLGRGGQKLLPLIADGAAGIEALQAQARGLGLTVTSEDAQSAAILNDTLNMLARAGKQVVFVIGAALAPLVIELAAAATRVAVTIGDWVRQNKGLVVTVFKVAAAVTAAGVALVALGGLIIGVGAVFGMLATTVAAIGTALGALAGAVAFLVTPIGLLTAAIVALGATLLHTGGVGAEALRWLGDRFRGLRDDAVATFRGIGDALAAGDIALAARILWLSLRVAWLQGTAYLKGLWVEFRSFFLGVAYDAFHGALAAAEVAFHGIEVALIETTAFLSRIWTAFTAGFQKAWGSAVDWTTKRLLELRGLVDSGFDAEAAKAMVEADAERRNAGIDRDRDAALVETESRRAERRQRAAAASEATLAAIGRQNGEARAGFDAASTQEADAAAAAIAEARRQWEEAIRLAADRRATAEAEGSTTLPSPDEFIDRLEGVGDAVAASVERVQVRGTFNAAAVLGLAASGGAAERTAQATEETARNTKRIEREVREGGLAFE